MPWDELTRPEQRLLIRLFGGGSLRNQNAADSEGLSRRGFIDDKQNLSMPGYWFRRSLCASKKRRPASRWNSVSSDCVRLVRLRFGAASQARSSSI
jgi:hypothetical protein